MDWIFDEMINREKERCLKIKFYLGMFRDCVEQHSNDGTSQSLIVSTESMNQESCLIRIDVVFDLLI